VGLTFTPPRAGLWTVCGTPTQVGASGAGKGAYIQLYDGTNVLATRQTITPTGATSAVYVSLEMCGDVNVTSVANSTTVRIRAAAESTSTTTIGNFASSLVNAVEWRIFPAGQTGAQPLIPGSIYSNSSSVERIERLSVDSTCSSTPCTITRQSGAWVSSVTRASAGLYTVNIASGTFSAIPTCLVTQKTADKISIRSNESSINSSTVFNFGAHASDAATATDIAFDIICMGPR
jgi:hypothetical protein